MDEEARFLTLRNATGDVRRETHNGKAWTIVPVVALVEGVIHAVNAPSPELVRAAEFADCSGWEGMPVHAGHPMLNGMPISGRLPDTIIRALGEVRNAKSDDKRLTMEAWLDDVRCAASVDGKKILGKVTAVPPEMVEVSVGVFTNAQKSEGIWTNGKRYAAEWKGMRKDHLALLADGRGACSVEMGCGTPRYAMRVAADGSLEEEIVVVPEEKDMKGMLARIAAFIRSPKSLRALMPRGWGDDEVKDELREALLAVEPGFRNGEILRVMNDAVVYCLYPPAPPYYESAASWPMMTYWKRAYTFDTDTKKFTVSFEKQQVEPATVYEPVRYTAAEAVLQESPEIVSQPPAAPCSCGGNDHAAIAAQGDTMKKEERIAALAANPHSPVRNLEMLKVASEEDLTNLEATVETLKTAAEVKSPTTPQPPAGSGTPAPAPVPSPAPSTPRQAAESAPEMTEEQFLNSAAGAAVKSIVESYKAQEKATKDALVGQLKAAQAAFTEEELQTKPIAELQKLATLAKVEALRDFSLQGTPRAAAAAPIVRPDPYAALNPKAATH